MKGKTLMWDFNIIHIPGKTINGPDATSRYPVRRDEVKEDKMEEAYSTTVARRWQEKPSRAIK